MNTQLLIVLLAIATMGSRLAGLFSGRKPGGRSERFLYYVPFGLFAALVVVGTPRQPEPHWLPWIAAMAVTSLAAYRRASVFVSVAAGVLIAFGLSYLFQ